MNGKSVGHGERCKTMMRKRIVRLAGVVLGALSIATAVGYGGDVAPMAASGS